MRNKYVTRLIVTLTAMLLRIIFVSNIRDPLVWDLINGAALGLVVIQLAYLLDEEFNLNTWSFSAILSITVFVIGFLFLMVLYLVEFETVSLIEGNIEDVADDALFRAVLNLAEFIILVTFVILIIRSPDLNRPRTSKPTSINIDYNEPEINPKFTQVTRFLSATLLLNSQYRKWYLKFIDRGSRAFAPELGIDIAKLTRISYLLEDRHRRYNYAYLLITVISVALIAIELDLNMVLVIFVLSSILITVHQSYDLEIRLIPLVRKNEYGPDRLERALKSKYKPQKILDHLPEIDQNLSVYSGFTPFIGAGIRLDETDGWSFPINICYPKKFLSERKSITLFELRDLYDFVVQSIDRCHFKGFIARDYLFVNGTQVRLVPGILSNASLSPRSRVADGFISQYINRDDPVLRYYKWLQFYDWSSELIVSYIIRFSHRGEYLFVEVNRFLLTPLDNEFRSIDDLPRRGKLTYIKIGLIGMFTSFPSAILGTVNGLKQMPSHLKSWLSKLLLPMLTDSNTEIQSNVNYDYGATESLRETVSIYGFNHYFQKLDKEMYFKVVEKQILEAINSFLEKHNIDTSDLKARQITILNNGVIVQGQGKIEANAIAAGEGAKAAVENRLGSAD